MRVDKSVILVNALVGITFLSATILSSTITSATDDTVIDEVNVTVPVSCSMEGTGMNSHETELFNNEYDSNVGTTNIKAYCNDVNGFAIYAIGYTDDTDGKNVLTDSNLSSTNDITTGVATTGSDSKWAMKLATVTSPTPTYPITIQSDTEGPFTSFHTVPDDYTLVAKRTSATDAGSSAIGSTFTTTYQIYIGPNQSAGTYNGQVKYVLVHPNYIDQETLKNAVTVVFDGNGLTFPGGATTNTVKYANLCEPGGYGYVGNTPYATIGTSNLNNDGTQNQDSPYTDSENILQAVTVPNANKVKVVVDYGITGNTMGINIVEGAWDGDWNTIPEGYYEIYDYDNTSGTKTYLIEGNTVTIFSDSWDTPEPGYDYGFYVKVYPVYNTEQPNTTYEELPSDNCSIVPISGTYTETTTWNGKWTATIEGSYYEFKAMQNCQYNWWCYEDNTPEGSVNAYIMDNFILLRGTTLTLYAYNPYTFDEAYANANKTKVNGYYTIQDLNTSMCSDVTIGETTTVIDIRDNNTYIIGKLKDGNCWMRENLKLNPTDSTTASNMSASNTNATNDAIYNYLHGGNPNNIAGWTDTAVTTDGSGAVFTVPRIYINTSTNKPRYNFCAVSTGTYCYDMGAGIDTGNTDIDAPYDVCPINWRLPTYLDYDDLNSIVLNDEFTDGGLPSSIIFWTSTYYGPDQMTSVQVSWGEDGTLIIREASNTSQRYRTERNHIRCILPTSN